MSNEATTTEENAPHKIRVDVITLFPEMFEALRHSILGRAAAKGVLELRTIQLRNFAINDYGQVDDSPYGGEPGMVLRPEPLAQAIRSTGVQESGGRVIYLSATGKNLSHGIAARLATSHHLVLVCGHYKGIDERVVQSLVHEEISLGDFVLTGGELAAMVLTDAIVRLVPGVLGDDGSAATDSHAQGVLGWPVYTRPENFEGMVVPPILLSGHHKRIREWQRQQALQRTQERRPDLWEKIELSKEDHRILKTNY